MITDQWLSCGGGVTGLEHPGTFEHGGGHVLRFDGVLVTQLYAFVKDD